MSEPFVGEIRMFAGNFAPRGWAFCDGQLLAVSQNDALFSLIGTIYGGDGRTTFALPDMRGRLPVHQGQGPGLSPRRLGARYGSEKVNLTINQIPSHSHEYLGSANIADSNNPASDVVASHNDGDLPYVDVPSVDKIKSLSSDAVSATGGSQAHQNMMPSLCINYIMALVGIYPSRH